MNNETLGASIQKITQSAPQLFYVSFESPPAVSPVAVDGEGLAIPWLVAVLLLSELAVVGRELSYPPEVEG